MTGSYLASAKQSITLVQGEDRYLRLSTEDEGSQIELTSRTLKTGYTVREVPIVFEDRRVGHSKMSRKIFLEALTMVWKLRITV